MKVAIGLSGGVDSAVSAALLKKQGHDVLGVFLWCYQTQDFPCTTDEDRAMAVKVADHLHIPIKIIDLRRDYTTSVVDYFFSEYKVGRTPNPDVMCNKEIKFGLFYQQMIEKEKFDYVATGHYARILTRHSGERSDSRIRLWTSQNDSSLYLAKGLDDSKDQSYFLYTLKESQLEHILFPVGQLKKEGVRKLAKEFKLPNADRPDSQGICFIGEVDVKKFLKTKLKPKKGLVRSPDGEVIGEHEGVWFYTIGQRHGFKITSQQSIANSQKPLYILSKNSERNELVVGEKEECYTRELVIEDVHWINSSPLCHRESRRTSGRDDLVNKEIASSIVSLTPRNDNLIVRIRHLGEMYPCKISNWSNLSNKTNSLKIILVKSAFAVASGQSAVLYNEDIVLGGGIIK